MRLTATTIRQLSLPRGIHDKVFFDQDLPGFGLRLRATGVQTWLVQYAVGGRTRRVTLGSPALLDPSQAREQAKRLLASVRLGRDPVVEKQAARAQAYQTFGALLPRFLERQRQRQKPRSFEETLRHLDKHARSLHPLPVTAIERRTIAALLGEIAATNGPAAANRTRASLSAYCTWLARDGFLDSNPVSFTNKAPEIGARSRVPTDHELVAIWRALGQDDYGAIVKLLILSGCRRDEIGGLRWDEIDLDAGTITLPPERTKSRREHLVPLSSNAAKILIAQPRRTKPDGTPRDHIFGNGTDRGFSGWSKAKRALDRRIAEMQPIASWVPHDFRRLISTALHERFGTPPNVVEAVLGHVSGHRAGVRGVYNRAEYFEERRRALQRWGNHIAELVSGERLVKLRAGNQRR